MFLNINLITDNDWKTVLEKYFETDEFLNLNLFLTEQEKNKAVIFPPKLEIFNALNLTPINKVKVVILGQDPYHKRGQAHGLCFSVNKNIIVPPSLKSVFKKLNKEVDFKTPDHGCLINWANQGVLLLNTILTVEEGCPAAHKNKGWEGLTDYILNYIIENKKNIVFLLWGNFAKQKKELFKNNLANHKIMEAAHPAPPYSHTKFLNESESFANVNKYLVEHQINPINWELDEIAPRLF
jgi:uracil-DNA glycosylase